MSTEEPFNVVLVGCGDHETETRRALRLELHVCEKPMAENLTAARAMADAAQAARKVLVIGYQDRWMHPGLLELRGGAELDDVFSAKPEWRRFHGIPGSAVGRRR